MLIYRQNFRAGFALRQAYIEVSYQLYITNCIITLTIIATWHTLHCMNKNIRIGFQNNWSQK